MGLGQPRKKGKGVGVTSYFVPISTKLLCYLCRTAWQPSTLGESVRAKIVPRAAFGEESLDSRWLPPAFAPRARIVQGRTGQSPPAWRQRRPASSSGRRRANGRAYPDLIAQRPVHRIHQQDPQRLSGREGHVWHGKRSTILDTPPSPRALKGAETWCLVRPPSGVGDR